LPSAIRLQIADLYDKLNVALNCSLFTTEICGVIAENLWLEGRQIEVGLLNWTQTKWRIINNNRW
jgi:hypothetical protein